jgi:type II secretory pathway pseudopilin PulG
MVNGMLMRKPAANKMTGLTLLETMFALAVGAFVLIAAVILYKSIRLNASVNQVMSDMNSIRAGYKSYLASGYQFNASDDAAQLLAVQNAGFLPSPLNDPWGLPYAASLTLYPGYLTVIIPGLNKVTPDPTTTDPRCQAIWKAAQTTGALSTNSSTVKFNCAFRYRFP